MLENASTHPTSTSVQRLFNFSWKFMIEGDGESQKESGRKSKTQPSFTLFGISRAAQQPEEKGYIISVHLHPDSTMTLKHALGALETHPVPTMDPGTLCPSIAKHS